MPFKYNTTGIKENFETKTLPEKVWFDMKIIDADEAVSKKNNYPMVNLKCEVINDAEFGGTSILHNVTFLPKDNKGAGMSVHFMKCIGVPHEGDVVVDAYDWIGKRFKASTVIEEYEGKRYSKIKLVSPLETLKKSDDIEF